MKQELSNWEIFRNGIFQENIIFKLAISLCPSIAVTNNIKNGLLMGIAVWFVHVMVEVTVSVFKKFIHPRIRIPIFMLIISVWVTVINLIMAAFVRDIYGEIGLYLQLIVAFASLLARSEAFAAKNTVMHSFMDAMGMGIGFMIALVIISFFRELIGAGAVWGQAIVETKPVLIFILPAGGFFTVGILMAFFNWMELRGKAKPHH
ncbi:MAG: electron transport complex subunit RsxE [Nitrospirae bacterium]|nr:electron transport complex subunit RsxE [Nitrospirota bacterium]